MFQEPVGRLLPIKRREGREGGKEGGKEGKMEKRREEEEEKEGRGEGVVETTWFIWSSSNVWRRQWQPTPVFLPGESQGWGSLVGCHLWGRTESDTTEAT